MCYNLKNIFVQLVSVVERCFLMDFSLDTSVERIYDKRTKELFREVVSSYEHKNYRSAIVMLYTGVICDLIYKMQDLQDIYQDKNAEDILNTISKMQKSDPNSSKWEETLIQKISEQIELLSPREREELMQLKKLRNLSAHPVLTQNYNLLYIPTKEVTLAHIRNVLEAVLMKPPLMSRKVIDTFIEDIATSLPIFITPDNRWDLQSISVFLTKRYFNFMGSNLKKILFKTLWKFVFKLNDENCNINRMVNFYALESLYQDSKDMLKAFIRNEPKFFLLSNENVILLAELLLRHPELYDLLQEDVQVQIQSIKNTNTISGHILGVFLSPTIEDHCEELLNFFYNESIGITILNQTVKAHLSILYDYADTICKKSTVQRCYIKIFANSYSYEDARIKYQMLIMPYLDFMGKDELLLLINSIKNNRQIYECIEVIHNFDLIDKYARNYFGETYSIANELS